ncbi:ras-interacting protein RIP3 [Drosophila mojavensis]|uniref:Uncharacterized protein n=1 Tax=Drosophila mojavensis TaxID=7230 RepID=B4KL68_DROMO|nr:ras-interacting protein RIP3 [Drosophila mojavensis]EDW11729.1 uncharacterized protein Dmoj_GI13521 [Drosophila mojavensis]
MSYLLTEIALEMLGYKFYDTNGVFHLINFQQSTESAQSEGQTHPQEPSLSEFIDRPTDAESEKNNRQKAHDQAQPSTVPSTIQLRGAPVRALAKMMEFQNDKQQQQAQKQQTQPQPQVQPQHQQQQQKPPKRLSSSSVEAEQANTTNPTRRTPAKALANILTYEKFKIRNQIKMRMEKTVKKEPGSPSQEALQECLMAELKKLVKDANDMREFRQFLEERLKRIDPCPYENYVLTFPAE